MFEGGVVEIHCELAAQQVEEGLQELHARLKSIGVNRGKLDALELELLFDAEDTRMFRRFGYPTMQAARGRDLDQRSRARSTGVRDAAPSRSGLIVLGP
jgi:hypothetical protein